MRFIGILATLVLACKIGNAELSKTYPLSPVTTLRMEAFTEVFRVVHKDTETIKMDDWDVLGSSYTFLPSNQAVTGFYSVFNGTVATVVQTTWTLKDYTDLVFNERRGRDTNLILDEVVEPFLVFPSTGPCPTGWKGWKLSFVNGKYIPGACP